MGESRLHERIINKNASLRKFERREISSARFQSSQNVHVLYVNVAYNLRLWDSSGRIINPAEEY